MQWKEKRIVAEAFSIADNGHISALKYMKIKGIRMEMYLFHEVEASQGISL